MIRHLQATVATVAALVALATPLTGARAPEWQALRTPQFTVFTQLSEKATRTWAEEFCRFIGELQQLTPVAAEKLPPLTVVIFARERDFQPYRPLRPDGRESNVAGFFASRETWSITGMYDRPTDQALRETVFHEGVHWYHKGFVGELPRWVGEGLAEVFSTFEATRNEVRWGRAIPQHISLLQREFMPLTDLLMISARDSTFNSDDRIGLFYAQSWAFVHFLLFGEHKNSRSALGDYLRAQGSGIPRNQAFHDAFGKDHGAIERELRSYIRGGSYFVIKRKPTAELPPMETGPASRLEIECALARLALGAQRHETARTHIARIHGIAPEDPAGFEMAAFLAYSESAQRSRLRGQGLSPGTAIALLDPVANRRRPEDQPDLSAAVRAVELGSKDAWIHVMQGLHLRNQCLALGGIPPKDARTIANCYKRAINLSPFLKRAHLEFASMVNRLEPLHPTDVNFLLLGRHLFPNDAGIVLGSVSALTKLDRNEEAEALLGTLLADEGALDARMRPHARRMLDQLLVNRMRKEIAALSEHGRYREILPRIDALLEQVSPGPSRMQLASVRQEIAAMARLEDATSAADAGRLGEARTILEEILASKTASRRAQEGARAALRRLNEKTESREAGT